MIRLWYKQLTFLKNFLIHMEHESSLPKENRSPELLYNQSPSTHRILYSYTITSHFCFGLGLGLSFAPCSPRIHVSQSSLHLIVADNAKCEAPSSSRMEDYVSRVPWSISLRCFSGLQSVSELVELFFPVLLEIHDCERNA
jgi:hypothetical protein